MPAIVRRKTSDVQPSSFQVYAGDEPRPGGYRAILKSTRIGKSSGDNLMFKPILELKAAAGSDKARFDGYPVFPNIVCTDEESNKQREQAFYLAIGASADPAITCDVDPQKFKKGDGQVAKVLKIDKIKPEDIVVNVKLRMENDNRPDHAGEQQLKCDLIFASRDGASGASTDEEDEDDDDIQDEEEIEEYQEDDLLQLGLPALRKILVDEFGMDAAEAKLLKSKAKLVEAILAEQEEDSDEEEEDEDEEDEDQDDEEDDDEDQDLEPQKRAEAEAMNRTELKAAITSRAPQKFLKSQTDADLVEILVPLLLEDPPF